MNLKQLVRVMIKSSSLFFRALFFGLAVVLTERGPAPAFSQETTGAPPSSSQSWCFAFVADTHIFYPDKDHNDVVEAIARDMKAQNVALALFGGDLIRGHAEDAGGLTSQYQRWLKAVSPLYEAGVKVYAVPGNHEKWGKSEADQTTAWNQNIASHMPAKGRTDNPLHPGMEYCFSFKNAFFIGLDEFQFTGGNDFPRMFRSFDTDWVAEMLASRNTNTTAHVFIFGHCPAFMADTSWPAPYNTKRDEFWRLLMREHVTLYLAGHNHVYARSTINLDGESPGPVQLIVGTGGGTTSYEWFGQLADTTVTKTSAWSSSSFGYALVTISGLKVHVDWRSYDWNRKAFSISDHFDAR